MGGEQQDIVVNGEVLARLISGERGYILFSLDSRLRDIDQNIFPTVAAAREAVLVTLDTMARDAD